MVKLVVIFLLTLSVSSCGLLPGAPTLGVEAVVGTKEEALVGQVGDKNEISSESISGGINTTNFNIEKIPPWVFLISILGWMAPRPKEIWRGLKVEIKGLFSWLGNGIIFWRNR